MTKTTTSSRKSGRKSLHGSENLNQQIQEKAFELYQRRGGAHGDDQADWFEAERIVLQEHRPAITRVARSGASGNNKGRDRMTASRRKTGRRAGA